MNYIKNLQLDNATMKQDIKNTIQQIIEMQKYYRLEKFQGFDNDFAHVSTDVAPKLDALKLSLQITLNKIN